MIKSCPYQTVKLSSFSAETEIFHQLCLQLFICLRFLFCGNADISFIFITSLH